MIRLLLFMIVFGSLAVVGLFYFDLIQWTPEGQNLANQAEQSIRNAAETAGSVLDSAVSE